VLGTLAEPGLNVDLPIDSSRIDPRDPGAARSLIDLTACCTGPVQEVGRLWGDRTQWDTDLPQLPRGIVGFNGSRIGYWAGFGAGRS
jgi:hypothetical protein